MTCRTFDDYLICKDFLFVNKTKQFEESIEHCKNLNYELAKIKIKDGKADDDELKKYLSKVLYNYYYRICLQFRKIAGTWVGQWANGDRYDNGELEIRQGHESDKCFDVIIYKDMKSLFRIKCDVPVEFICRKPQK